MEEGDVLTQGTRGRVVPNPVCKEVVLNRWNGAFFRDGLVKNFSIKYCSGQPGLLHQQGRLKVMLLCCLCLQGYEFNMLTDMRPLLKVAVPLSCK